MRIALLWTFFAAVAWLALAGSGSASSDLDLIVQVKGSGQVTSTDQQIDCPGDCEGSYPEGQQVVVELIATPKGDETFTRWEGCDEVNATKCRVTMTTSDRVVAAYFSGPDPEPSSTSTGEPSPTTTGEPSPTTTGEPSPTTTGEPSPTTTAEPSPAGTGEPSPTTTPTVQPTATPTPSEQLRSAAGAVIDALLQTPVVRPRPKLVTLTPIGNVCPRGCVISAVLYKASGGGSASAAATPVLARGSTRVRAGRRARLTLRFTARGRRTLARGRHRVRLSVQATRGSRRVRQSRALTLRVKGR